MGARAWLPAVVPGRARYAHARDHGLAASRAGGPGASLKRLGHGGRIDRTRRLPFSWNGGSLVGFAGDTLASALLGSGIDIIGTSVSSGRPRGVSSAGLEEATAFAQVTNGAVGEPLVRMTTLPLFSGLSAEGRTTKGLLTDGEDDARFDKRFAHCDLLV